jgi:CopG family nickel-responsive transcriptional regulator
MPGETSLARLSISLPAGLLQQLDVMVAERALPSRSQLLAELIRQAVADHGAFTRPDALFAGTITLVYAGTGRVRHQLARVQAAFLKEVISAQHVFLEDDQSLEVLLVQGPAARLKALADALRAVRGVSRLDLVSTNALLPPLHDQPSATFESPTRMSTAA